MKFYPWRRLRISAGYPHSNGSVNGAIYIVDPGLHSRPARPSTSPVSSTATVEFAPAHGKDCKSKSSVVWPGQQSPLPAVNQ